MATPRQLWGQRKVTLSFWAVVLVTTLVTTLQGYQVVQNRRAIQRLDDTHVALCTFKIDLEGRARSTRQFIDDIKHGLRPPINGISIKDLERSYASQRVTLDSLAALKCRS